jgi:GT2 family glycosyltransferase
MTWILDSFSARMNTGAQSFDDIGIVAIGRNEGDRLVRCLESMPKGVRRVVYVDSGSQDGSIAAARARGAEVVELDMSTPFTAARARNAGWQRLLELEPDLGTILFLDGDCELVDGFLDAAAATLKRAPDVVAVCGWRRERFPERSPYNTVCDIEWRGGAIGSVRNFGGDVLIRATALRAVGGYDPKVIAAEDDELGVRLRRHGGHIVRIDSVSTIHDAAMTKAAQWWRRAMRCGHGYAQVFDIHGHPPERYFSNEVRRSVLWGLALPVVATALAPATLGASLSLLAAYPLQAVKTFRGARARGLSPHESLCWSASCTAAKLPEALGVLKYHHDKIRRRQPTIIEYKTTKDEGTT